MEKYVSANAVLICLRVTLTHGISYIVEVTHNNVTVGRTSTGLTSIGLFENDVARLIRVVSN